MSGESKRGSSEKVTLSDFIEENYKLLASMGVFGGLTTLFTRIENAEYIVFLSFMMFLVLGAELWTRFPKDKETSLKLNIFQNLMLSLVLSIFVYLVLTYTEGVFAYLIVVLPIIAIGTFLGTILDFFKKPKKITRANILTWIGLIFLSLVLGGLAAFLVDLLMRL